MKSSSITAGQAAWLILLAAVLWFGGNYLMVKVYSNDMQVIMTTPPPQVVDTQLHSIQGATEALCEAKGYSSTHCKKLLGK